MTKAKTLIKNLSLEQFKAYFNKLLTLMPPDRLSDHHCKVLGLRYGLLDGRLRTLEETGKEFRLTRERIREIESKALRKLCSAIRLTESEELVDFCHQLEEVKRIINNPARRQAYNEQVTL